MGLENNIPEGWVETTLGEVVTFQRGFDLPTKDRTFGKYPLMVSNGQDSTHNEFKVSGPGVVTGRSGSLGNVFYVKKNFWPLNTTLWIKDFFNNDKRFVYYFLTKFPFERYNSGSGVPTLNRNHIHPLPVLIPLLPEQKAIANVLTAFDDKIELLQQQNQTLETIAQTIFNEWFGKYKIDDDLPEGWRVDTLENFSDEITRGFTTKYVEKSDLINLNQKVNKGSYLEKQHFKYYNNDTQVPSNKFIKKYDLLLNSLGEGTLGRVHLYCEQTSNVVADQHITILRFKKALAFYVYQVLISKRGNIRLMNVISGTTGMLMLNVGKVRMFSIIVPDDKILSNYESVIVPLYEKLEINNSQIQSLTKTRDTLLPKLMSGQVRVKF